MSSPPPSPPPSYPPSTPHLNPHNLLILSHQSRGRGVYASQPMQAGTLIEISPVLVFPREEWLTYGNKTLLDCYTFKWGGMGDMALALGLGSLFNHSPIPSVSFSLDKYSQSIRYTLARDVVAGEELCISYGPWGKQYEDSQVEFDEDDRQQRHLNALLRIGDDRSDTELEGSTFSRAGAAFDDEDESEEEEEEEDENEDEDEEEGGIHVHAHGIRRAQAKIHHGSAPTNVRVVRRSRTRYINGVVKLPCSSSSTGSDSGMEVTPSTSVSDRRMSAARSSSMVKAIVHSRACSIRAKTTRTVHPSAPLWRLTSLPDPSTVPLELRSCFAILIPPKASSQIMSFLRRYSRQLGRGKTIGSEEDPLRHAKTLVKKEEDAGRLRALICRDDVLEPSALKALLAEVGLAPDEIEIVRQQVASSPAPIKERAIEWSASWPVALRTMAASSASGGGSSTPGGSPGPSTQQLPSAIAAAVIGSSSPRPAAFVNRKNDCAYWTAARTRWVVKKLARCMLMAEEASRRGELPIGVHVCPSILPTAASSVGSTNVSAHGPEATHTTAVSASATAASPLLGGWDVDGVPLEGGEAIEVDAFDTRISQRNPIKHAVGNAIRNVAEIRAYKRALAANTTANSSDRGRTSSPVIQIAHTTAAAHLVDGFSSSRPASSSSSSLSGQQPHGSPARSSSPMESVSSVASGSSPYPSFALLLNGQDYLLTSLTLFTTHEPCVYCCMSLVHSRVRNVIFLEASPGSGGCCGSLLPKGKRCDDGIDVDEGGPYALQEQRGLNHRYEVWKWRGGLDEIKAEVEVQRREKWGGQSADFSATVSGETDKEALLDLSPWGALDP